MMKFTLDTNCIIDVAEERPAAGHVRCLLAASQAGAIDLALVASSAAERQKSGEFLASISVFRQRCEALGFGGLELLPPIARWDMSFWDHALCAGPGHAAREEAIYRCLFPSSPCAWEDFAAAKGADKDDRASPPYHRWRNQMLDAQAFWAHEHAGRDVFVTSDRRFLKLMGNDGFAGAMVKTPEDAAATM